MRLAHGNLPCQMGKLQMTDHGHLADRCSTLTVFQLDREAAKSLRKSPCGTDVPSESPEIHISYPVSKKDIFLCNVDANGI